MTAQLDAFAGAQATQEAIERADATVTRAPHGDALIAKVVDTLRQRCRTAGSETFTGDNIALILDAMQVPRDNATRKRIVSTVVNRGRGKLWDTDGWESSHDPRRHGRPLMRWRWLITP